MKHRPSQPPASPAAIVAETPTFSNHRRAVTFAGRWVTALAVAMSTLTASAAVWYLDSAATGTKNGSSWANAWTEPSSVVWGTGGVKAGDTLYISGGSTTKNYSSTLAVGASGTSSAPIAIRVGQEPDHNGVAILPAISINTRQWIQIDGSRNPSFVPPTSVWQLDSIAGNLGLRLTSAGSVGIYVNGDGGVNNCVRYVEVGPVGSTNNIGDLNGIRFLNLTSLQNWKIEYCWIHDIQNDGINLNSVTTNPQQWDALTVRWCIIERTGDDGIQSVRNGLTVSHCFLRDHWVGLYNGHPDQLQLSGVSSAYLKIVNNIFRNKANSLIIGEQYVSEGGTLGPMLVAGNVFYNTRDWVYRDIQAYGATFDAWRANNDVSVTSATWTNLYLLNNTVYYQRTVPFKIGRAAPDGNTRSVWKLFIKGSAVQNNLLLECGYNGDGPIPISVAGAINSTNGLFYDKSTFPLSHNVIAGKNTRVSWGGTVYPNAEALNTATGLPGNTSTSPNFESVNNYDFRLTSADSVARNKGFNLGALTNRFPELMRDLWGNQRGLENAWDIGASEYGTSSDLPIAGGGLVTRLNFSDSFADGAITDFSGRKNHGLRFGHLASPTNWPRAIAFTNPASGLIGTAASFRSYPRNGWGTYNTSGDYVAITNVNEGGLQNLTKATVALWVKRDKEPDADGDGLAEWNQDQGRYICSGYGYAGAWSMGMFTQVGAPYSYLRIYTGNSATSDVYLRFGEGTRVITGGGVTEGSMPWVHLAFTWDNGAVQTYFNGTPIHGTNLPLSTLTCRGPNGSLSTGWIGLGCDTHNGNPALTPNDDTGEQYPNHAWFNGALADLQIYNRVLSPSELNKVYRGEAITTDPLPEPPATPTGLRVVSQ